MNKPTLVLKFIDDNIQWRLVQTSEENEELLVKMLLVGFQLSESKSKYNKYDLYKHPALYETNAHWNMSKEIVTGDIDFHCVSFSLLVNYYELILKGGV